MVLTNGSKPKPTNIARTGGLFGSRLRPDDNVGASDDNTGNTQSKDTQFGQSVNQFHPPPQPPGYHYLPSSHHFQALLSSTTRLHSTWHQALNLALVRPNNNRVMGHCGKNMISPKGDMVDLKCFPCSNSQDMSCQLQVHLQWLQHPLETIQSFGRTLLPPVHQDNFWAYLGDPPLASQRNDITQLQNRPGQMF